MTAGRIPALHLVTTPAILEDPRFPEWLARLTDIPTLAVHIRGPGLDGRILADRAGAAIEAGITTLVNDRADIAVAVHAAGVHLPERGLPPGRVRSWLGPNVLLGQSTHDSQAAHRAVAAGADYVFLGPVFPTASHPDHPGLGLDAIRDAPPGRTVAIGGITPDRVSACLAAGAVGVAVIRAVWDTPDPGTAARTLGLLLDHE